MSNIKLVYIAPKIHLLNRNMITHQVEPRLGDFQISVVYRKADTDNEMQEADELKEDKEDYFLLKYTPDQRKNIDMILNAFASDLLLHVKLIIATNNKTEVVNLEGQRRSQNVTVLSSRDAELLDYLYAKAWGFINCSLTEISKLTVIKAQRRFCKLVLSDTKTFRKLFDNEAKFFDPASVQSVIAAIQSALKDS